MSGKKIENKIKTSPRPSPMKTAVKQVNNLKPSANTVKPANAKGLPARKAAPFTVIISASKKNPVTIAVSKKITVKKVVKKNSFSRIISKNLKPSAKKAVRPLLAKKPVKTPAKKDIRKSAAPKKIAKNIKPSAKKTVKLAVQKKTLKTPVKAPARKDIRKSAAAKKTPVKKTVKPAIAKKPVKTPLKASAKKVVRKSEAPKIAPVKRVDKKAPAPKKTVEKPKESSVVKSVSLSEDLKKSEVQADKVVIPDIELTQKAPELPPPEERVASEETYHSDDAETLVVSRELVETAAQPGKTAPQTPSAGETGPDAPSSISDTAAEAHIQDIGQISLETIDEEAEFDANIPAADLKLNVPLHRKRKTRKVFLTIAVVVLVIILVNAAVIFYKSRSVSVEIRSKLPETHDVNKVPAEGLKTESALPPEVEGKSSVTEQAAIPGKSNDAIAGIKVDSPETDENEPLPKSLAYVRDQAVQAAREGKFNESFVVIERLLDIGFAKNSLLSDKMIILVWAEKYYLAIDMFESYRKKNAPDINLLNAIGTAYRKTGRYNDAIKCCDESLALNNENPDAVKGKVFSMIASGRSFEAYEYIRNEMKNRQNVPVWLSLLTGEAYVVEGRTDEAEIFFSEFLKANPGNVFAKRMLAGILVHKKQKLDVAEKMIDEILSVEPANIDVMFLKVTILQSNKHYPEAYELNEKILSLNKRYQPSLNAKPQILMDMKTAAPATETPRKTDDRVSFPVKKRLMGDFAAAEISGQKPVKPAQ